MAQTDDQNSPFAVVFVSLCVVSCQPWVRAEWYGLLSVHCSLLSITGALLCTHFCGSLIYYWVVRSSYMHWLIDLCCVGLALHTNQYQAMPSTGIPFIFAYLGEEVQTSGHKSLRDPYLSTYLSSLNSHEYYAKPLTDSKNFLSKCDYNYPKPWFFVINIFFINHSLSLKYVLNDKIQTTR